MARGNSARTPGRWRGRGSRAAGPRDKAGRPVSGLRELSPVDRAIYSAVAATLTPFTRRAAASALTPPITPASGSPSRPASVWRRAGRAAVRGTVAIGVTSALVNLAVKSA
jgi:hypothetical protein